MWRSSSDGGHLLAGLAHQHKVAENLFQVLQVYLVGAVAHGVVGVLVHLHEHAVNTHGHGGIGQHGSKLTVAAGGAAQTARTLHGVGGIEHHGAAELLHPVHAAHVHDEVVVAEGSAAFAEHVLIAAEGFHLFADVLAVPGSEELALLDVDRASGLGAGFQQVALAAQESRYLEQVNILGGVFGLLLGVHVGHHRALELLADFGEDTAAFLNARAAEAFHARAVGFVVGGLEDELHAEPGADFLDGGGHFPGKGFVFKRAGPEQEEGFLPADDYVLDVERHGKSCFDAYIMPQAPDEVNEIPLCVGVKLPV